jgi:hypothetical protein
MDISLTGGYRPWTSGDRFEFYSGSGPLDPNSAGPDPINVDDRAGPAVDWRPAPAPDGTVFYQPPAQSPVMSDADALALWLSSLDPETLDFVLQAAADAGGDSVFDWLPSNWQDLTGAPAVPEAFGTWKEQQQQRRIADLIWFAAEGARQPGMVDKAGFESLYDMTRVLVAASGSSLREAINKTRSEPVPFEFTSDENDPDVITVRAKRPEPKPQPAYIEPKNYDPFGGAAGWSDKAREWAELDPLSRLGSGASPYKIDDQGGGDVQVAGGDGAGGIRFDATLSPLLVEANINTVVLLGDRFDHIRSRHATGQTNQGGTFDARFVQSATTFHNLVVLPALRFPSSVFKHQDGSVRIIATLPYNIGTTGTYRGQPNISTNEVILFLRPVAGVLGSATGTYQIHTATPRGQP